MNHEELLPLTVSGLKKKGVEVRNFKTLETNCEFIEKYYDKEARLNHFGRISDILRV